MKKNKTRKILYTALGVLFLITTGAQAADKTLSVVSLYGTSTVPAEMGEPISLQVKIDDAAAVAGASFTIEYETVYLTLDSIESTFFDTFVNQGVVTTPPDDPCIIVDNNNGDDTDDEYCSPVIVGSQIPATGNMLAAARLNNGTGTDVTLFTLNFLATGTAGDASVGPHTITIAQSNIDNEDAGYLPGGEYIPFLVGIDGTSYISYPDGGANIVTTIGCNLAVTDSNTNDSDSDGIDDNWELFHAPNLSYLGNLARDKDTDGDGYSDYQEYLNRNELDPAGNPYDPDEANAPDGTGYETPSSGTGALPAIYMLLLGN